MMYVRYSRRVMHHSHIIHNSVAYTFCLDTGRHLCHRELLLLQQTINQHLANGAASSEKSNTWKLIVFCQAFNSFLLSFFSILSQTYKIHCAITMYSIQDKVCICSCQVELHSCGAVIRELLWKNRLTVLLQLNILFSFF